MQNIPLTLKQTQLKAEQLTRLVDVKQLPASTKRLSQGDIFLGQHRAKQAIEFAVNMPFNDYHLCAVGTPELGKRYKIKHYLQQWIKSKTHAQNTYDLCETIYVHQFKHKNALTLLRLKYNQAHNFVQHFAQLWLTLIPILKQSIILSADELKSIISPYFKQFYQRHQAIFYHQHLFKNYLDDCCSHISYHAKHIISSLENDYMLHADVILQALPSEYHLHIITQLQQIPIIYEPNPDIYHLFGHIHTTEKQPISIQAGSLLKANGGFLLLDLGTLLQHSSAYYLLKQCLKNKQFDWSNIHHHIKLDHIPLNLKVVLLCDDNTFDQVLELDDEFTHLFKIRADFTDSLTRTSEHEIAYIHRIADLIKEEQFLHFDRHALAELLTESSRLAEDQNLLTLHDGQLRDLLRESQYYALQHQADMVSATYVQTALQQRLYRLGYWRDLYWQDLSQGTQLIETKGVRLGQVNALSVVHFADTEFGFPSRLTASVSQGAGDILDIERSVELGGSLHAKGTLLMSSFLKSHFGRQQILNFSAALAFEQSYGEVDGDSATVAELCALISAISQIPIQQSWAITGSMNQLGQVQAVGGINAKIEGFFDACQLQGLTGIQGVIIPYSNIQHLMLRADIIQAVKQGQFHIHAIHHVEQALEILMNRPVGVMDKKGFYSEHSIYEAVMIQLANWQDDDMLIEEEPKKKKKSKK